MLKFTPCILRVLVVFLLVFNSSIFTMEENKKTSTHLIKRNKKTNQNYFEVMQNEMVFTNTHYPVRFLFTGGLGPCVGLVLQAGDWIAFAHLDGSPMSHALHKVINHMNDLSNQHPIEATIITSRAPQESTFRRLIAILDSNGISYHHIKDNTEYNSILMDKRHKDISTGISNPGIKNSPVTNPSWDLGQKWDRLRPGQFPMLKLIIQEDHGEFIFNPDPIEEYLALRHSVVKTKPDVVENPDMAEEEAKFLQEKSEEK